MFVLAANQRGRLGDGDASVEVTRERSKRGNSTQVSLQFSAARASFDLSRCPLLCVRIDLSHLSVISETCTRCFSSTFPASDTSILDASSCYLPHPLYD